MQNFLQKNLNISYFFLFILFLSVTAVIALHFYSLIQGFYLTGDTISALDISHNFAPGSIFQVFKWHYAVWPPGLAFIFNLLSALPFSIISQNHIYVFIISMLNVFIVYLIAKNITQSIILRGAIIALSLFSGIQSLLFLSTIAEPMFVFFWLTTIYLIELFMEVKQERYIFLLIGAMSMMTLSRYSGIWVNLTLIFILLLFVFFDRKRNYSAKFIIVSMILAWMPIVLYLTKNALTDVSLFGHYDLQFKNISPSMISTDLFKKLIEDLRIPIVIGLLIGTLITWSKQMRNLLILTLSSAIAYFMGLIVSQIKYRVYEHFPSRLSSVAYPEALLASVAIGSLLIWKYPKIKILSAIILIPIILFFGYQSSISFQRLDTELKTNHMWIPEIENSQDIRRLCRGKTKNKYLFIQDSSRNWIGQSLKFYCLPIEKISLDKSSMKIPQNALIYTPYKLEIPILRETEVYGNEYRIYGNDYRIYVYQAEAPLDINIKEELTKRENERD